MTIFRWIMGVLSLGLVSLSVLTFVIFILRDDERWIERARLFRRLATVALLFWFNAEVWGRVIYTIVTWK